MVAESTPAARETAPHDAPAMLETIELNGGDTAPSARAKSAKNDQKMASKDLENGDSKSLNGTDDAAEQAPRHAASDERTFVNAIIAFLGSGILGLPYAFRKTGIVYGLATLVAVAVVSTYAMLLVVECKYKLKARGITIATYGDIGFHAMGRAGRVLVDTAIVVSQAGFCVAYLIFIVTNAHQFLGVDKALVVSVCVPPLIAFSLLRHMKELAYVALAADVMNFVGLAVVYTADLSFMAQRDASSIEVLGVVSSIPFFFGVASYCFEGVGMVLPLENGMEHPTHFKSILICTVIIITTLYATFGICGYLAFGDATLDVVTLNLTDDSGLLSLVKLCLCAGLFFAYPIMMFPVFQILEPLVASARSSDAPVPRVTENQKIVMMKSVVVVTTAALAVGIPNFGQFISFIGSTCCTLLAFVLPSSFHLMLFPRETSWPKAVLLAALIALGVVAVAAAVADTGKKIFG